MEDNKNCQSEDIIEDVSEDTAADEGSAVEKNTDTKEKEPFSVKKELFSWLRIIVIAVVIAFTINNFIIMNANVPSGSMMNTIMKGDRMIGLRTAYWFSEPERGGDQP